MKRIVICADGTWNIRDQVDKRTGKRRPTNVTKVARAIRARDAKGIDQIVYYHDGVGTRGGLDRLTGGAFGHGLAANVREMYRFILYNHEAGDELFFFGFSRGAFTVRTLAGFMRFAGLVEKDDDYYIPNIYRCYERSQGPGTGEWQEAFHNVQGTRPCPPITFVGVWDTVGALGAPGLLGQLLNRGKYKYHDVALGPHIQSAFQALALEERRKPFAPSVWNRPADWDGTLEQAWFPGVHSDVGGSYTPDGLANEALHWMVERAERLGLEVDDTYLAHFLPCFNSVLHDSMSFKYRLLGPYTRRVGAHARDGECVHRSAMDRLSMTSLGYEPENLLDHLKTVGAPRLSETTRIRRGMPCADLPTAT